MKIGVGARESRLSIKQLEEVLEELKSHVPDVEFNSVLTKTTGDLDLLSSLGPMDKTNFFTKEIDQMLLEGKCQVAIHSAKDLPRPLPKGLKMVALTRGKDPADSLVMRVGESVPTLKKGGVIGSSSERRDRVVRGLRPDLQCTEVRGTVEKRLEKVFSGEIEGLVVAEAALIRLGLTHLNRIPLPGKVAPLQGKLAVIACEDDYVMENLFSPLDTRKRKKALHVGLNANNKDYITHLPLIKIMPRDFDNTEIASAFADIPKYTHIIFTSKSGVDIFFDCLRYHGIEDIAGKEILAVGQATAQKLREKGALPTHVATHETQEGIIHLLAMEDLEEAYILLPQSSKARPAITHHLMLRKVRHELCHLYDTRVKIPAVKPNLENFDEIIFTSPSTIEAFIEVFGKIPKDKKLTSIGPITDYKLKLSIC